MVSELTIVFVMQVVTVVSGLGYLFFFRGDAIGTEKGKKYDTFSVIAGPALIIFLLGFLAPFAYALQLLGIMTTDELMALMNSHPLASIAASAALVFLVFVPALDIFFRMLVRRKDKSVEFERFLFVK